MDEKGRADFRCAPGADRHPAVWFHIDPSNIRSRKATAKLGAKHVYDAALNLSGNPASWSIVITVLTA